MSLPARLSPPRSPDLQLFSLSREPLGKTNHLPVARNMFDRTIFPIAVAFVDLRIVEDRRWWLLPLWNLTQYLRVLLQESIDHLDQLTGDATYNLQFAAIGPLSFVVRALLRDQSFVQPGPLTVKLNGMGDTEKEHLFHGSRSAMRQLYPVECRSRNFAHWSPPTVGFEL